VASLLALLMSVGVGQAQAAGDDSRMMASDPMSLMPSSTKGPFYGQSEGEKKMRKLVRGFANVTLCLAEIPNQAFQEAYRTSPVTGTIVGAAKGVVKGGKRFLVGLWEMATFYHPTGTNYEPVIEPEVVFQEFQH
jgi:putative exosortase-associated protein (TIGR04073 family)